MRALPVAELKREFSDVLDAAERGEPTIVLRHGKPVAVVAPVSGKGASRPLPAPRRPGGLLAIAGLLADWDTLDEDVAALLASRRQAIDRLAPELD